MRKLSRRQLMATGRPPSGGGGGSFPEIRSHTVVTGKNNGETSVTITKPTGTANGDLLLLVINYGFSFPQNAPILPSGFEFVYSYLWDVISLSTEISAYVAFKIAGPSEPSSYTISGLPGNPTGPYTLIAISGVNTDNPFDDISANVNNPSTNQITFPATQTNTSDKLVLFFGFSTFVGNTEPAKWPGSGAAGTTRLFYTTSGSSQVITCDYYTKTGTTSTSAVTQDTSDRFGAPAVGLTIVLGSTNNASSISRTISASADDVVQETNTGGTFEVSYTETNAALAFGYLFTTKSYPGFRFTNITIPKDAKIISATLNYQVTQVNVSGNNFFENYFRITSLDNIADWTSNRPWAVSKSGDSILAMSSTAATPFSASTVVTNLIQTLVNRAGWSSGNAAGVVGDVLSTTVKFISIGAFDNSTPATLTIRYRT